MANRLIIFEDKHFADFYPLTMNRPVYFLRCGALTLWGKLSRAFDDYDIVFSCRGEIAELVAQQTNHTVNHIDYQEGDRLIFINGRLRLGQKLTQELLQAETNKVFLCDDTTAAIVIVQGFSNDALQNIQFMNDTPNNGIGAEVEIINGEFEFYHFLWDLIHRNANEISADYLAFFKPDNGKKMKKAAQIDESVRIVSDENFYIAPDARINGNCVIDNRRGPVIIDTSAEIGPLSYIEGPCYIGPGTQIFRANIREGCSFGPTCRVGGEVEESIFQGFTNKYHDGFMGHAYLGSWVNLGAMTTNSDLKNNYKNISVSVNGVAIDTGFNKIGCMIGDHTKTGIGTLINTGVSIGFSCNIFGGSLVTSKEVLSFSWGDETGYDVYRVEKAIEVAKIAMARRNVSLDREDEKIFYSIFETTKALR